MPVIKKGVGSLLALGALVFVLPFLFGMGAQMAEAGATLTVSAHSFSPVENLVFSNQVVATVLDSNTGAYGNPGEFAANAASISWGDGTPATTGSLSPAAAACSASGCLYNISGSHTYGSASQPVEEGASYTVVATVADAAGDTGSDSASPATASIADGNPVVTAASGFSATEGAASGTHLLATFVDPNPYPDSSDYGASSSAVVDWGDGTTSDGAITKDNSACASGCTYDISAGHTYADDGSYPVKVTVADGGGGTGSDLAAPLTATVGDAALRVAAAGGLATVEGTALSHQLVATFTDANPGANPADFSATINWGDGQTSVADAIATQAANCATNCTFTVSGSHTYAEARSYGIAAHVTDIGGALADDTATPTSITVSDAALSAAAAPAFNVPENGAATGQLVATFTDANAAPNAADFGALINWGDGSSSPGTITLASASCASACTYDILGTHTYAAEETHAPFAVTVTVSDGSGSTAGDGAGTTATIIDAPLSVSDVSALSQLEGASLPTGTAVATFTDGNPRAAASDFTASINWGDAAQGAPADTSVGTVSGPDARGVFTVTGGHAYTGADGTTYSITATVTDAGGASAGNASPTQVSIADQELTMTKGADFAVSETGSVTNQLVATFTDADPSVDASAFSGAGAASIDWGDGSTSAGTVALANPNCTGTCLYNVTGSHTYGDESASALPVDVTVTDAGGSTVNDISAPAMATVSDVAPSVTAGGAISATEGVAIAATTTVATFSDPAKGGAADFPAGSAVIDWGDGTAQSPDTSLGTISAPDVNGVFTVTGGHLYSEKGSYTVGVTITDGGGASGAASLTATVADGALSVSAANFSAPDNAASAVVTVGSFTDADPTPPSGDYTATIDWGDGTAQTPDTGAGAIVKAANSCSTSCTYDIQGSHTYAAASGTTFKVVATVSDADGATGSDSASAASATITDAPLTVVPGTGFNGTEGADPGTQTLATFTDASASSALTDFTTSPGGVSISWGDGSAADTTSGRISGPVNGVYTVTGDHTYREAGVFKVVTTITDSKGASADDSAAATPADATIADAPLSVTPAAALSGTEGSAIAATQVATFTDAYAGAPAGDYAATVDWGDGTQASPDIAKATVGTANAGVYPVTAGPHTYSDFGSYTVTVTVSDTDGAGKAGTLTATIGDAAITVTKMASSISATEGAIFTGQVGTLADSNPTPGAGDFPSGSAVINWGDGTAQSPDTSTGTLSGNAIDGSHTYAEAGSYTVTATVSDAGGAAANDSAAGSTLTVADAALTMSPGLTIKAIEGNALKAQPLATFTDANPAATAADFSVTDIGWGDATADYPADGSAASVTGPDASGLFTVLGTHTYADKGTDSISVSVKDVDSSTATNAASRTNVNVSDGVISVSPTAALSAAEGALTQTLTVATFTDSNPSATTADFSGAGAGAVIHWGDGSTSTGSISGPAQGEFSVTGTHTYADDGSYGVTTYVTDVDAGSGDDSAKGTAISVADAALTVVKANGMSGSEGTAIAPVVLATFTDANPAPSASDFSAPGAALIDWGDGSTSPGTVTGPDAQGVFSVSGGHLYADEGSHEVIVTVTDSGGAQASDAAAPAMATIAETPISVSSAPALTAAENVPTTGVVATLTDTNPQSSLADFGGTGAVSINWGDGSTSGGTVSLQNPLCTSACAYNVSGTHTYSGAEGTAYQVYATVTDDGGATSNNQSAPTSASVIDAPLSVSAVNATFPEFGSASATVARLTDANPTPAAADFSGANAISIDWGDGSTGAGRLVLDNAGCTSSCVYDVVGTHTYSLEDGKTSPIKVSVTDAGGSTASDSAAPATASISDQPIAAKGLTINVQPGTAFSGPVATLTDANPSGAASDYSASISWGDGQTSSATGFVANTSGGYSVIGTHTYSANCACSIAVSVRDKGGQTASATSATSFPNAGALSVTGLTLSGTEDAALSNVQVATFVDTVATTAQPASDYTASIDWGDGGAPSAGTVSAVSGGYAVSGSHTYAEAGRFGATVSVTDADASTGSASAVVNIADAPLSGTGVTAQAGGTHIAPDQVFANAAYQDLLGRQGDSAGLAAALNYLAGGGSRATLGRTLESSAEYQSNLVRYDYQRYLNRQPSASDLAGWTAGLSAGMSDEQLLAAITGSPEFFHDAGGTNANYVSALWQDLLLRGPTTSEDQSAVSQLQSGLSPSLLAASVLNTAEYRAGLVQGYYASLLHRTASSGEVATWVSALSAGAPDEAVKAAFVGSFEYYEGATTGALKTYVAAAYQAILLRAADTAGVNNQLAYLAGGGSRIGVASNLTGSDEYRGDAVQSAYQRYLGRSATSAELAPWVSALGGGLTDEMFDANVVGSPEFFTRAGGTNNGFVSAAYKDILGRAPDSAAALNYINSGGSHYVLAQILLSSTEYRTDLVNQWYQSLLGRTPSSAEVISWVSSLNAGLTDEAAIDAFAGSEEFSTDRTGLLSGATFSGVIAHLADAGDPLGLDGSEYTAHIDWGDGTGTSGGSFAPAAGGAGFAISGSHTYTHAGQYTVTLAVTDAHGSATTITSTLSAG